MRYKLLFQAAADSDPPRLCFMAKAIGASGPPLPEPRLAASRASKTLSLIVRGAEAAAEAGKGGGHSFGLEAHWSEKRKVSDR